MFVSGGICFESFYIIEAQNQAGKESSYAHILSSMFSSYLALFGLPSSERARLS